MVAQSQEKTKSAIDRIPIRRALISVYDKTGLDALARALAARGVELYSTGGTEKYLKSLGLSVIGIRNFTQSPEIFGGRLKTLHPMVHGGLLFRRDVDSHLQEAEENGILAIDLLVVNLYPFEETVARPGATEAEIIEQIDIGGPAMLRSAAKNFEGVAVVTSPEQYKRLMDEMDTMDGATGLALRKSLAMEGFGRVAQYDRAIADYFQKITSNGAEHPTTQLEISLPLLQSLRYGENPHQSAALYGQDFPKICTQLWGKELSYNNILDVSSALGLISEFVNRPQGYERSVAAIIKHTNPCGVAEGKDPLDAFDRAFRTDPESPFGGIIILNDTIDEALAARLNEFFSEVILAPKFTGSALDILKKKKDRRLIQFDQEKNWNTIQYGTEFRSVVGGVLRQDPDRELVDQSREKSVTRHSITEETRRGLYWANKIVKHLKSNATAFCGFENGFARTLGLGAGQTSRVESVRIAVEHANRHRLDLHGSFVAGDAFFPFADGLIACADAGAVAIIEPGGSVRDAEVIQAAEERGIALIMTGMRHFKH